MPWYTYRCQFHFPAETTASSLQLSGFGINNCQLMLSCPLPLRRSSLDWQAARQLRRQFRDICPVFICTSARFYQLQGLGCYRLSQALNAHLPCTTLLNSEDLCIIGRERERERERNLWMQTAFTVGLCTCSASAHWQTADVTAYNQGHLDTTTSDLDVLGTTVHQVRRSSSTEASIHEHCELESHSIGDIEPVELIMD